MNQKRRREISNIIQELEEIRDSVEKLQTEEEESLSKLPDSLQDSEKGMIMQECIEAITYALHNIEESIRYLDKID